MGPDLLASRSARLYWMLAVTQAAHSVEEVVAGLPEFARTVAVPRGLPGPAISDTVFAAVNVTLVAALLAVSPFVFARRRWARGVAWTAALIELLNAAAHLGESALLRMYVPGTLTAPLLALLAAGLVQSLWREPGAGGPTPVA